MTIRYKDMILLSEYIDERRKGLESAIRAYQVSELTDENLVEELLEEYYIEPLKLLAPAPVKQKDTIQLRNNGYGGTYDHKGKEIRVQLPFEGDPVLFSYRPSQSYIMDLEMQSIDRQGKYIYFTVFMDQLNEEVFHQRVESAVKTIGMNIPNINRDIAPWNSVLRENITSQIEMRIKELNAEDSFMKKIGLNINPRSESYMPPPVRKKIIPAPAPSKSKGAMPQFVPELQQAVYTDIIQLFYNLGQSLERKPSQYKGKGEEDLRDTFLLYLESRYDGAAGVAEAFNKKGKTDILLKYAEDGTNIFVAECKIWKGQKKFHEAIDQLLGYLTHRDSKTALMIFVQQKDFTTVLETAREQIKLHPQYKRRSKDTGDSSFGCILSLPGDPKKEIQIEVMLFHFPEV